MSTRTDEELEEIVERLLRSVGLWGVHWLDMMTLITALKREKSEFRNYERVSDELMPDAEAQWDATKGVLRMRESVFRAMQNNSGRARNTIAEEIGHFALGHVGILNRSIQKSAIEKSVPRIMREEAEAKRFAPRLLAPAKLIPAEASPDDLVRLFGISRQSALIRREELDRMRRRAEGKGRELPSFVVDFLKEARRRGAKIRTDLD